MDLVEAYVEGAMTLQGFQFPPEVVARVVEQFRRIAILAEPVLGFDLQRMDEVAPVFTVPDCER
ncbi:DUF4089 domain-containing protein [Caballeronia sp. LjRoot34]|uniref:DUF4089 domain-containing protein n=1 Tax=Caballeronia sp. LjRoot34 TaxID=3342325 RepID=UPI003ECE5CA2